MAQSAAASERTQEEEASKAPEIKVVKAENAEDLYVGNASGADENVGEKTGTE